MLGVEVEVDAEGDGEGEVASPTSATCRKCIKAINGNEIKNEQQV